MEHAETLNTTEETLRAQTIWTTLSAAQREIVLRTIVQICCQIVVQREAEVQHEPDPE